MKELQKSEIYDSLTLEFKVKNWRSFDGITYLIDVQLHVKNDASKFSRRME